MQTDQNIEVHADIPGVKKEDINIDVDGNILTLSVNQKKEKEREEKDKDTGITWHHSERSSWFVKRAVRLPDTANTAAAKATYTDGVLAIDFPKKSIEDTKTKLAIT
jgi:HSP20 family protein